ncbi:hypothetical protein ZIOFF_015988 [Zingiber officinale]|uniref:Uncharacterized protein n=1 Tax=Zingiber officinale TaxID=94328 RepID=A0A8J5HS16_ZINOF|nr:hypothetical protein ZIOFF_015988 [Zingiber officinale]
MEFSYQKGREVGPEYWGWTACGKGRMQSPVDLSHERVQVLPLLGLLRRSYRPVVACYKIATTTSWCIAILYTLGRGEPFLAKVLHLMLGTHRVGPVWTLEFMQGCQK